MIVAKYRYCLKITVLQHNHFWVQKHLLEHEGHISLCIIFRSFLEDKNEFSHLQQIEGNGDSSCQVTHLEICVSSKYVILYFCYILLNVATCCCILLHTATCWFTSTTLLLLLCTPTSCYMMINIAKLLLNVASYCYMLLHIATYCYKLLHTASC